MGNVMATDDGDSVSAHSRSDPGNRMAISAMANVTQLDRSTLLRLRARVIETSRAETLAAASRPDGAPPPPPGAPPSHISRAGLRASMEGGDVHQSDREILDRLFTMFDRTGDDAVDYRELLCGISPLVAGTVREKLEFAFAVFDASGSGQMRPQEMAFVLQSCNACASFFGDMVMTSKQIHTLVEDIYRMGGTESSSLSYRNNVGAISAHPVVLALTSGQGTVRYTVPKV